MAKPIRPTPPVEGADATALLASLEQNAVDPLEMARRAEHSRRKVAEFMAPKKRRPPKRSR